MLSEFIEAHRDEIISRCREKVVSRSVPPVAPGELEHGVPTFLHQLQDALNGTTSAPTISQSAGRHGQELLTLGFTVSQVVHDYGDVCQAITELSVDLRIPLAAEDFQMLNKCLDDAIASAVTQYGNEDQRVTAETQSERASEQFGFFAHELRNLVNTASLALEALKAGRVGIAGSTGTVLDRSISGLKTLIGRSVAEVRLTRGISSEDTFLVADLIAELGRAGSLQAHERDLRFTVAPVGADLAITADRQIVDAVIGNLLQNAFKFTQPGTSVTLRVSASEDRVFIEVQDECGGFPPAAAGSRFPVIEQRSADRTGLGLGLAFCRWGAEVNHGRIDTRNIPGSGCVFILDLPRVPVPSSVSR